MECYPTVGSAFNGGQRHGILGYGFRAVSWNDYAILGPCHRALVVADASLRRRNLSAPCQVIGCDGGSAHLLREGHLDDVQVIKQLRKRYADDIAETAGTVRNVERLGTAACLHEPNSGFRQDVMTVQVH